jgi:hypothetical protein
LCKTRQKTPCYSAVMPSPSIFNLYVGRCHGELANRPYVLPSRPTGVVYHNFLVNVLLSFTVDVSLQI